MGTGDVPDPHARRLRSDTPDAERPGRTLAGFLDDSERPDYKRLYLTADGSAYVEFPAEAATFSDVPPDQYPFPGEQATLVRLLPNARVEYTYTRVITTGEFDLHPRRADIFAGDRIAPEDLPAAVARGCWPTYGTWNCTYAHTCR